MNAAEIKELYTAMPFKPFELVLPEGGAKRIDVKLITAVNELPPSKSRRKK